MFFARRSVLALIAFVASASAAACSGEASQGNEGTASSSLFTKVCKTTKCESWTRELAKRCEECQLRCIGLAAYGGCGATSCSATCQAASCWSEEWADDCEEHSYEMRLPPPADAPELVASCKAWVAHENACIRGKVPSLPQPFDDARCERTGFVYTPAMSAVYRCDTARSCDDEESGACRPPPSTLGDEVFAAAARRGCTIDDKHFGASSINWVGGGLRPELARAARACTEEPSCADVTACLRAWDRAVSSNAP